MTAAIAGRKYVKGNKVITNEHFAKMDHMTRDHMMMDDPCMMGGILLMALLAILLIVLTILGVMSIIILYRKHFSKRNSNQGKGKLINE